MGRLNLPPVFEPLKAPFPDGCANISGDPHVLTFDGLRYDFQAVGEFIGLTSDTADVLVQVRLAPVGTSGRVSVISAIAVDVGGRLLIVDGFAAVATLDGVAVSAEFEEATADGGLILRHEGRLAVLWPDHSTSITITGVGRRGNLNLYATLAQGRAGRMGGLLGDGDGVPANDLALPDGTPLGSDFATIHGTYRDAWRVPEGELLFDGPSTFDPALPVGTVETSGEDAAAARLLCINHGVVVRRMLDDCVFDVAVTQDEEYARRYAEEQPQRLRVDGNCGSAVGELVSMEGGDARRTFATSGELIGGQLAWEFTFDDGPSPVVTGVGAAPEGYVVIDMRRGFHWLDLEGRLLRTVEARPRRHVPAVTTERVYGIVQGGLLALAHDGTLCWQLLAYEGEQFHALGLADGRLFVATSYAGVGSLLALDPASGAMLWSRSYPRPVESWATDSGRLVIGVGGAIYALEASTGQPLWVQDDGGLISAAGISDETAYSLDLTEGLAAYDLASGTEAWRYRPGVGESLGFTTHFALGGQYAVVVNDRYALGVRLADGSLAWSLGKEESARFSQPAIAGDVVYFLRDDLTLIGHALADGQQLLRVELPVRAREAGPPVPSNSTLLVTGHDGSLRAYR